MDILEEKQVEQEEVRLSDYIRVISYYKWVIIAVFILSLIITVVYTVRSPKIYKTSGQILIENNNKNEAFMFNPAMTSTSINNTKEILKSNPVIELAYKKLKNDPNYETFPIYEFTEMGINPVKLIKGKISIETKADTDLLTVSYESTSPKETASVVNSVVEALIQTNRQESREELTNIVRFLDEQLMQKKRELQFSEEDLREFKRNSGISILSEETSKLIDNSAKLEAQYQVAQTDFQIAMNSRNFLKNELSRQDSLLVNVNTILTSPLLEQLRVEIVQNQTKLANLLTKNSYTMEHPEIIALNREIKNAKENLDKEVRRIVEVKVGSADPLKYRGALIEKIADSEINYNVAKARVMSLKKAIEDLDIKMSLLPDTELELARLDRTFKINDKIYSMLLEKFEDAKISEQARMGNIRWVEKAETPLSSIKPKKTMNLMVGVALGLFLGIGLAFILHSTDRKLRTLDDVERFVHLPIYGTVPKIDLAVNEMNEIDKEMPTVDNKEKELLERHLSLLSSRIVTFYAPKSPASEAYRTFRTNILTKRKEDVKCMKILITSSGPKEGKSTTISNLGIAISQMGAKVAIIDIDLRRPMIANIFGMDKEVGSSDFLSGEINDVANLIKSSTINNLDIITSGIVPPNPSELISSDRMDLMLEQLAEIYDFILIDSPPVIAVTDSLIIGKKVDQMVIVVRTEITEREVIKRTKEIVRTAGLNIDGVVVNGIDVHKYYSGYSYYNYYYYYYGKTENNKKKS